ncbi:C40 family peptidase [Butyrivibrio sp. INlla16]|uniref:C40 family peptidase n=1 Tax=Butyrivibrio sp. INlla16 TaxID=1520807 RepID=UPI0008824C86|nr:C40 family peptidase [Butyrivibrio sp. INlla16]SDB68176.1 Cell wall-associated hydrolase, NlpC family [Butyrivibrio sp. INlla16]
MRKYTFKAYKKYICAIMAAVFVLSSGSTAFATTSKELKEQQKELEKEKKSLEKQQDAIESEQQQSQSGLDNANRDISNIQGEQTEIQEGIDAANEELTGLLTSIDLIQSDIEDTQVKIEKTQQEYDEAKSQEETLYDAMKKRIKFMYEKGEFSYAELLLQAQSVGDMLNKAGYAEELYDYDRTKLSEFVAVKEAAQQYGEELEEAKSELETSQYELKEEQAYVETVIDQYKKQYANFDVQLAKARQNAAVYSEQLKQQTSQIRDLQAKIDAKDAEVKKTKKAADEAASKEAEEARKKKEAEEAAKKKAQEELAKNTATDDDDEDDDDDDAGQSSASTASSEAPSAQASNTVPAPAGSASGQNIANYACQFVGNPYVPGGTSLTNGADCSGFVYAVYKAFGITVPRTSYSQATYGREVSYQNAQAGDVIYYGGHVGIYLGGGRIVHASTARTGIKYENATYRTILTIRRFVG